MKNSIINFDYKGSQISFNKGKNVMINATEMAKPFGKRPAKWLELPSTKEFLTALTEVRKSDIALIQTDKGGINGGGGTWMYEDVALEFARWLSPSFAIWCNDRLKELMKTGVTTVSNDDEAIAYAMSILQKRLAQAKGEKTRLELESQKKQREIEKLLPKADFADAAFDTDSKVDIGMSAKILRLGFGRNILFKKLKEKGILFGKRNEPKQKYIDAGYFELTEKFIERKEHPGFVVTKILVTQKGLAFINEIFGEENAKKLSE